MAKVTVRRGTTPKERRSRRRPKKELQEKQQHAEQVRAEEAPPTAPAPATRAAPRRRRRARSPFGWLRALLLVLFVLSVASIAVMLAAYRFGRLALELERAADTPSESVADDPRPIPEPSGPDESIVKGMVFDHMQTNAGVPIFRIRADQSRQNRSGNVLLQRVILDVFREDGATYTITSQEATFNEDTLQARLSGTVVLKGWGDLELEARALELHNQGKVLTSSGEVRFRYPPNLMGRAAELRVDRRNDTITLGGGVHLHTTPEASRPMRLDCDRVVYQRSGALLRAVGDVALVSDGNSLHGHYVTLFLTDDQKDIDTIRARWKVHGTITSLDLAGAPTVVEYRGEFLDMQPQAGGAQRIKLDGEGGEVMLKVTDPDGVARTMTGLYLTGQMRNNRLTQVEGAGAPMIITETVDLDPPYTLRQLCAGRIQARFLPDGQVGMIELDRQVELTDRQVTMTGGRRASLNLADGLFRIEGRGDTVELFSQRAEVRAGQFTFASRTGLIRAYGGVRAVLAEQAIGALRSTPLGQARGPVQVEADEAYWTATPPTFTFEGDVRAWRGESLVLADQMRGDEEKEELTASGNVRTVWVPEANARKPQPPQTIEVNSENLAYLQNRGQLIYNGSVELRQGQRALSCEDLAVDLTAASEVERMICEQDVRLVDQETGKRALGDRAVYVLENQTVEIFGEEVQLFDAANQMKGRYLVYDLTTGTVNMRSSAPPKEDRSGGR